MQTDRSSIGGYEARYIEGGEKWNFRNKKVLEPVNDLLNLTLNPWLETFFIRLEQIKLLTGKFIENYSKAFLFSMFFLMSMINCFDEVLWLTWFLVMTSAHAHASWLKGHTKRWNG